MQMVPYKQHLDQLSRNLACSKMAKGRTVFSPPGRKRNTQHFMASSDKARWLVLSHILLHRMRLH
ncbi:MAG: hypothetical protein K2X57_04365 [Xanthobacteraceae bacterium]|nr:hypothetical protein [Xanthobacteraceae bacterium]